MCTMMFRKLTQFGIKMPGRQMHTNKHKQAHRQADRQANRETETETEKKGNNLK